MKTFLGNAGAVCRSCCRQYEFDWSCTRASVPGSRSIERVYQRLNIKACLLHAVLANRPDAEIDKVIAVPAEAATFVRRKRPQFVVATRVLRRVGRRFGCRTARRPGWSLRWRGPLHLFTLRDGEHRRQFFGLVDERQGRSGLFLDLCLTRMQRGTPVQVRAIWFLVLWQRYLRTTLVVRPPSSGRVLAAVAGVVAGSLQVRRRHTCTRQACHRSLTRPRSV